MIPIQADVLRAMNVPDRNLRRRIQMPSVKGAADRGRDSAPARSSLEIRSRLIYT